MSTTGAEAARGEVIAVPNTLRAKVGERFAGVDPMAVARAEAALKALSAEFDQWMNDEVTRLEAARARVHAEGRSAASLAEMHLRAHDLKGLGSTYGFPLATRVCASLCRLLDDPAARSQAPSCLIDAHVDAARAVLRDDIRDPTHPLGLDLCTMLEARVARHASSQA